MSWILLGLLAPLLLTVVNFVDKYIVAHKIKNNLSMPIYVAITALVFGTGTWLISGRPFIPMQEAASLLGAGMISLWAFFLYFYALSKNTTSYVIALRQTTPLFILFLSFILLDTTLSTLQLYGFATVLLAVLGLSISKIGHKIRLTKAFYAVIAAAFLFAVAAVIIKSSVGSTAYAVILAYESWGLALGGAILYAVALPIRQAFLTTFRAAGTRTLTIMFSNEILFIVSKALTFLAISLGPVALVGVLAGSQVFYGIAIGLILTLLFPHLFHEVTAKQDLLKKIGLSLLLFIGISLISMGEAGHSW